MGNLPQHPKTWDRSLIKSGNCLKASFASNPGVFLETHQAHGLSLSNRGAVTIPCSSLAHGPKLSSGIINPVLLTAAL